MIKRIIAFTFLIFVFVSQFLPSQSTAQICSTSGPTVQNFNLIQTNPSTPNTDIAYGEAYHPLYNLLIQAVQYDGTPVDLAGASLPTSSLNGASVPTASIDGALTIYDPITAQNLLTLKTRNSAGTERIKDVAVDTAGNIYYAGEFTNPVGSANSADLNLLGAPNFANTLGQDAFIGKINVNGTQAWSASTQVTSGGNVVVNDVKIAPNGDIIFVGEYQGTVDWDYTNVNNVTTTSSNNSYDIFVADWNSTNGGLNWVYTVPSSGRDVLNALAIRPDGYIIAVGGMSNTGANVTFPSYATPVPSYTNADAVVLTLSSSGTPVYARFFGSFANDSANDVSIGQLVGNSYEVYITGFYGGSLSFSTSGYFNPSNTFQTSLTSAGEADIFTVKYTQDATTNALTLAWAKSFGSNQFDEGKSIRSSAASGCNYIEIAGNYRGNPVGFGANVGQDDIYVGKLTAASGVSIGNFFTAGSVNADAVNDLVLYGSNQYAVSIASRQPVGATSLPASGPSVTYNSSGPSVSMGVILGN